jgi:hypothetical protein
MLLRRVIEHVRTQNWTAVALDFVIVVVGVFIGIQVANWNERQAERSASDLFIEPLRGERRPEVSVTFQQLVASGDLKLIKSERVRRALASRSAQREEANRAIGFNHNVEPAALGSAFIQPTFQAASPNADTVLQAALVDPEYTAGLRVFFGLRLYNDNWFLRVHKETQRVLAILEEEVKSR